MDTPIYDALAKEWLDKQALREIAEHVQERLNSDLPPITTFKLTEEDVEQVPAVLTNAAHSVGQTFSSSLHRIQPQLETQGEFSAYVDGVLDALEFITRLPKPENKD